MKVLELKNLIREEVQKVLEEGRNTYIDKQGNDWVLPYELMIVWHNTPGNKKKGFAIEYELGVPKSKVPTEANIKKGIDTLLKIFPQIKSRLQAELVGKPMVYTVPGGSHLDFGNNFAVGIMFKTKLTWDQIEALFYTSSTNRQDNYLSAEDKELEKLVAK